MSWMKLARVFAFVACALLLHPGGARSAASARPASRNLLSNPGFERGFPGHDWMPTAWDTSDAGLSTVFFGRDSLLVHGGHYAVNIANTSIVYPMNHNWSQTLLVSRDWWGRTATFSTYSRSSDLQGRAFVMVQAYRDTSSKMARVWGVDRTEAMRRLGIQAIDDPQIDLGWKRLQFSEGETPWVRREVRVLVPAGTNVLFVRCGLIGTGQVLFDDASLVLDPAPPVATAPAGKNLFVDPSFEEGGLAWEWSVPPFEGARVELDSAVFRTGRYSMRCSSMREGLVSTRAGVSQPLSARGLRGQRVRLSAWVRADSLIGTTYLKIYSHAPSGVKQTPGRTALSNTFDWTPLTIDFDVAKDADELWPWVALSAPCTGTLWIDDVEFTSLGPSPAVNPPPGILTPRR